MHLCHGFPEPGYSWRHQIGAIAQAGFRAVAPDMRGYGRSDQPGAIEQYTILHLVGDLRSANGGAAEKAIGIPDGPVPTPTKVTTAPSSTGPRRRHPGRTARHRGSRQ